MDISLAEILSYGGGGTAIFALLTILVEVSPIKINPWSAIGKWIGKAINADVLKELREVQKSQAETNTRLEEQVKVADKRNADSLRERILRFNMELVEKKHHAREDFIEILAVIDEYQKYCKDNPEYPNSRAVHAIANINRVYDERLKENDFYKAEAETG